jgi:hypothetical protein
MKADGKDRWSTMGLDLFRDMELVFKHVEEKGCLTLHHFVYFYAHALTSDF